MTTGNLYQEKITNPRKPYEAKIILVVATDRSLQIGSIENIQKKIPQLGRQMSMQVYDSGTRLVTGISLDRLCVTPLGIYRMVMPTVVDDFEELVTDMRRTRYGAYIVVGSQEVYEALLPFAHSVVHFVVQEDNYHSVFYGELGEMVDLTQAQFASSWTLDKEESHLVTSPGFPGFIQYTYENTGIPHFELKSPAHTVAGIAIGELVD